MEECELLGEIHEYEHSKRKRIRGGWQFWAGDHFEGSFNTKKEALAAHKKWKEERDKDDI